MTSSLAVEPASRAFVPRPLTAQSSASLDFIRALAAWAVMWGHVRAIFFVDFGHLPKRTWFLDFLYFVTGFGHQAVMVFFVLSGFLISSAIMRRHAAATLSWRDYAIDRSTRLYVVLAPGLLLGAFWDLWGMHRAPFLYSCPLAALDTAIVQKHLSLPIFIGNLAFLQTIRFPAFGSNVPLWSLSNEFWYYVLFPILFVAVIALTRHKFIRALLALVVALLIVVFVGGEIFAGFLVWLSGWMLARADTGFRLRSSGVRLVLFVSSFILFVGCLTASRFGIPASRGADFSVGFSFTLFLFAVLQMELRLIPASWVRAAHFCARFSFSLYVLHFSFLLFLFAWISPLRRWQPDLRHLLYGVLLGVIALAYAWLISLITEAKTGRLRAWLRNLPNMEGAISSTRGEQQQDA